MDLMADDKNNKFSKVDKSGKVSTDNDQLGENTDNTLYSTTTDTTDKAKDIKTKGSQTTK